jgi:8-oxo-dGTP pyrophosphatase MutT (NUDIX family)
MIKECQEEAGMLPILSSQCVPAGYISYAMDDANRGLILETDYTFDLQLPLDFIPHPADGEVAGFQLLEMDAVLALVRQRKFTPEAALVIVDFAIRHGIINSENEPNYLELISGLRSRLLDLPGP